MNIYYEDSSIYKAATWIIKKDPMQIKSMDERLKQRFALALLYFETTLGGKSFWTRCNPPATNEGEICNSVGDRRWLTGSSECSWHGVECNEKSGLVELVRLRESDMI